MEPISRESQIIETIWKEWQEDEGKKTKTVRTGIYDNVPRTVFKNKFLSNMKYLFGDPKTTSSKVGIDDYDFGAVKVHASEHNILVTVYDKQHVADIEKIFGKEPDAGWKKERTYKHE